MVAMGTVIITVQMIQFLHQLNQLIMMKIIRLEDRTALKLIEQLQFHSTFHFTHCLPPALLNFRCAISECSI